jgi:TfoX/Sxy family transcriptional regulator of competence genes
MPTESELIEDVRAALSDAGTISEMKMFGGTAFLLNGHMVAAASPRGLLLRVGKERHEAVVRRKAVRPMMMRGRMLTGYVYADPAALTARTLKAWLGEAVTFVRTLPPKKAGKTARKNQSDRRAR